MKQVKNNVNQTENKIFVRIIKLMYFTRKEEISDLNL